MNFRVAEKEDVDYMDNLLFDDNGLFKVVPASVLESLPKTHLMCWGNLRGVYCFPTVELIDWLREQIGGRKAIEICAGTGVIGRALEIPRTDSYIQTSPDMVALYRLYQQKPIFPPADVHKFEALEAVKVFQPEVVIGSYITQKYVKDDQNHPKVGSSIYGVDELALLPQVKKYITIGNRMSHGDKRLLKYPHTEYKFPWLYTRASQPEENYIVTWEP